MAKKGRGQPRRYPGEDTENLSIIIRPRYKELVYMLKENRGGTLSEAVEYALSKLGREYKINDTPIINFVRPAHEPLQEIGAAMFNNGIPTADVLNKNESITIWEERSKRKPEAIKSKEEIFFSNVLKELENIGIIDNKINSLDMADYYLQSKLFYQAVVELRKQAYTCSEVAHLTSQVVKFLAMYHFLNKANNDEQIQPILTKPIPNIDENWMQFMQNTLLGMSIPRLRATGAFNGKGNTNLTDLPNLPE